MDLQSIMRKYFRISVRETDAVAININNIPYEMIDVGDRGIGVRFTPEDILFSVGDEVSVQLKIEDRSYNLQGKVVHINPAGPSEYLCGIEFTEINDEIHSELLQYLQSCRKKIFEEK